MYARCVGCFSPDACQVIRPDITVKKKDKPPSLSFLFIQKSFYNVPFLLRRRNSGASRSRGGQNFVSPVFPARIVAQTFLSVNVNNIAVPSESPERDSEVQSLYGPLSPSAKRLRGDVKIHQLFTGRNACATNANKSGDKDLYMHFQL